MLSMEKWSCAEKGDRDRAKVPAVSNASYPGHLVNQSIRSLTFREFDFAGKRKLPEQMPLIHTSEAKRPRDGRGSRIAVLAYARRQDFVARAVDAHLLPSPPGPLNYVRWFMKR